MKGLLLCDSILRSPFSHTRYTVFVLTQRGIFFAAVAYSPYSHLSSLLPVSCVHPPTLVTLLSLFPQPIVILTLKYLKSLIPKQLE